MHVVHILHQMQNQPDNLAAMAAAPAGGDTLTLDQWMKEDGWDDVKLGEAVGKDRTTIYRIRTGRAQPSCAFIEQVITLSGGRVRPDSYFQRALARAAAPRGGGAQDPFSSTSSPPARRGRSAGRPARDRSRRSAQPATTPAA